MLVVTSIDSYWINRNKKHLPFINQSYKYEDDAIKAYLLEFPDGR